MRTCDADWNSWPFGRGPAEVARRAADLGLDGVEVGVYDAAVELAPGRLREWEAAAAQTGVPVAALLLSLPAERWAEGALGGDVDRLVGQVSACARVARDLGHEVLGVWPGADGPAAPGDDPSTLVDGMLRCVEAAGSAAPGLRLALEPKPATALPTADAVLALVDAADVAERVGVLLDTGHAWAAGQDPAAEVDRLTAAGRLLAVHLGDAHPGGADDDLPLGAVHDPSDLLAALRTNGWAGTATFDLHGSAVAAAEADGEDPVPVSVAALARGRPVPRGR